MLSVDPEDRFSNCTEAIGQLERALSGYVQDRARLFISYSHADRAVAKEFAKGLEETQRFVVWWDRTIVAGVDWSDQIEQGMENSDLMIVLLSRNSSISEEVKREWSYWIDSLERPIISLVIEGVVFPTDYFQNNI